MIKTDRKEMLKKPVISLPSSMGESASVHRQPWNFKPLRDGYLSGLELVYTGEDVSFTAPKPPFRFVSPQLFEYEIPGFIVSKGRICFSPHPDFPGLMTSVWDGWYPKKKLVFRAGEYRFSKGQPIAMVTESFSCDFMELSPGELEIVKKNQDAVDGAKPTRDDNRYEIGCLSAPPSKKMRVFRK